MKLDSHMNTILQILRTTHQHQPSTLAGLLELSESEYIKLEAGAAALTRQQAFALSRFYKIDIGDLIVPSGDVNYNTGTHSRGIFNVTRYYENFYFTTTSRTDNPAKGIE